MSARAAERWELIVVGGGPAGLSTALHLQAADPGRVAGLLVLERGHHPRPKCCAGVVAARAERQLARIGVRLDVPASPVDELALSFAGGRMVVRQAGMGRVVRRADYDAALVAEARRRGIVLREGAQVTGVELASGEARVRLADGATLTAQAVVGADGAASVVRRGAGLAGRWLLARAIAVETARVSGDLPRGTIHFDFRDAARRGYGWDFPAVSGDGARVGRGVYLLHGGVRDGAALRVQLAAHLAARGLALADHDSCQAAQRGLLPDEPLARPRALLVGEAAGIDVATGEGIAQAVAYGALAGEYLAGALRRGALDFADWTARVGAASFGRRLRMLHAVHRLLYGEERAALEQIVLGAPEVLRLWVRGFVGEGIRPVPWGRVLCEAAPLLLRHGPLLLRAAAALLLPD